MREFIRLPHFRKGGVGDVIQPQTQEQNPSQVSNFHDAQDRNRAIGDGIRELLFLSETIGGGLLIVFLRLVTSDPSAENIGAVIACGTTSGGALVLDKLVFRRGARNPEVSPQSNPQSIEPPAS